MVYFVVLGIVYGVGCGMAYGWHGDGILCSLSVALLRYSKNINRRRL